jgi:hypothetical protein
MSTNESNWVSLLDENSLAGWTTGYPEHGWSVENGVLKCVPGHKHHLYTEDTYENFVLSLDFCIEAGMNSGVFLRCSDVNDIVNTGIEIQVYDTYAWTELNKHACGAIYDLVAPRVNAVKAPGEWNTLVITCDGPLISVVLNDQAIAEMNCDLWVEPGKNPDGSDNKFLYAWRDMPRRGHILLQDYGSNKGLMWYRNIKIKTLA